MTRPGRARRPGRPRHASGPPASAAARAVLAVLCAALLLAPAAHGKRRASRPSPRPRSAAPAAPLAGLAADSLWRDGKAEFSTYAGTARTHAGDTLRAEAVIAVAREDLDRKLLVKSDVPADPKVNFPALKQVVTVDFRSGVYRQHLETVSFLDARTWKLAKLSAVAADAVGMTWVEVRPAGKVWLHRSSSYFDEEGARDLQLPAGPTAQALDALPLWLRTQDFASPGRRDLSLDLLPAQAGPHVRRAEVVPALVHLAEAESLSVPAGSFLARRVEVRYLDSVDVMYFDTAFPHLLLRWEDPRGITLELKKSLRLDYWNKTHPGDERLLGE
ncbi:MAG TPA: hypothetical protein VMS93_08110 [Candidatus Saccharimonadales bacterium]|nr:hypothetical protein [Candidatus Saccharimonadales bacterium]